MVAQQLLGDARCRLASFPPGARRRGQRRPDAGTEREDDGVRRGAAFGPAAGKIDNPPARITC